MNTSATNCCFIISRCLIVAVMSCALISCDTLLSSFHTTKHARTAKPAKTHYLAEAYVKHLALAELALEPTEDDLDIIGAYAAQKSTKPERQALVVFEYKTDGEKTLQKIIAPISTPAEKSKFTALLEIMNRLNERTYTLHNIHLAVVMVAPGEALKLPEGSINEIKQALDGEQQRLLDNAEKMSTLDDARTQLRLIRFFIDHHFRDAAYLSVDNVKHLLASATNNQSGGTDIIKSLSQELEALESQLHKTLPFTMSDSPS